LETQAVVEAEFPLNPRTCAAARQVAGPDSHLRKRITKVEGLQRALEFVDFLLDLLASMTGALLDTSNQVVSITLCNIEVAIGEFAPLPFGVAFQLFPFTFDDVFIHGDFLVG
jgi:hypothetical protein